MKPAEGDGEVRGRSGLETPRLGALAARSRQARMASDASPAPQLTTMPGERCDLCAKPIGPTHWHLVDLRERSLRCACRPCSLLFEKDGAGGTNFRLVPDRVVELEDFKLNELDWLALRIPVDLAFFFFNSTTERIVALYPGPMGATESLLPLDHWNRMERENPALSDLLPDVEALLVDRTQGRRQGWIVPIDVCYELVALFRTQWKGLSGGGEVWRAIAEFFDDLRRRAKVAGGVRR